MNTITLEPAGKGQVTATSIDGHTPLNHTTLRQSPLLAGERRNPATSIAGVWSSGSSHWSLRSTVGAAAKFTVEPNTLGKPVFRLYRDRRETGGASPQSS
jgi:hypothetical protein